MVIAALSACAARLDRQINPVITTAATTRSNERRRAAINEAVISWSERWLSSRKSPPIPERVIAQVRARLRVCLIRSVGEAVWGHRTDGDPGYTEWSAELEAHSAAALGFDSTFHELTGWRRCRRALVANACLDAIRAGPDAWLDAAAWAKRAGVTHLSRHTLLSVLCPFVWVDDDSMAANHVPLWHSGAESFEDALRSQGGPLVNALVPSLASMDALQGGQGWLDLRNVVNQHPEAVYRMLMKLAHLDSRWVASEASVNPAVIEAVPPADLIQLTNDHPNLLQNPVIRAVTERLHLNASATASGAPPASRAL